MTMLRIYDHVGSFGEDKDTAAWLRENVVKKCVKKKQEIVVDFAGVTLVTQSFIHALLSDILRNNGEEVLDIIEFKNCEDVVKGIISTVIQYSLDTMDTPLG